jgi:hypothetical protein
MKDFDKIIRKPKWDAIETEQAWRYITCIKVHLRKNLTIQITLGAAYLRHHQTHKPIPSNYGQLIEEDIDSTPAAFGAQDGDTSDEEVENISKNVSNSNLLSNSNI